jgi:hypothetical protein
VRYLKEEEIEYFINLMRYSPKDFSSIEVLKPLFNKCLLTLEKMMEELMLGPMFDKISIKILDVSLESTLKIMVRLKMIKHYRVQIIDLLKIIEVREKMMKELNYFVV